MHLGSDIFMMCRRTESFTVDTMRRVALYCCSSIESEETVVMTVARVPLDALVAGALVDTRVAEDPAVAPIEGAKITNVVLENNVPVVV